MSMLLKVKKKKCVIILTTRCSPNGKIGFVESPNHLNVSISRAQQLCFIIGNAKTLSNNEYWNRILRYIHENYKSFCYCKNFDDKEQIIEYDKEELLPFLELKQSKELFNKKEKK